MDETTKFERVGNCTLCGAPMMLNHESGEVKFYCECRKALSDKIRIESTVLERSLEQ